MRKQCAWLHFPSTRPTALSGTQHWALSPWKKPRHSTPPACAGLSAVSAVSNCWLSVWGGGWQERIIFIAILNKSGGISSEQKAAAGFRSVVTGSANYAMQIETVWLLWLLGHDRPGKTGNFLWSFPSKSVLCPSLWEPPLKSTHSSSLASLKAVTRATSRTSRLLCAPLWPNKEARGYLYSHWCCGLLILTGSCCCGSFLMLWAAKWGHDTNTMALALITLQG